MMTMMMGPNEFGESCDDEASNLKGGLKEVAVNKEKVG
jgi:hypothetical protein